MPESIYSYATKSWPIALGCDESKPCAARCWAKRTVNRLACSPNVKVREAHAGLIRTVATAESKHDNFGEHGSGLRWSGTVRLNEAHLFDPLGWRKPQIIATGYHGDWALLPEAEKDRMFAVMALTPHHRYLLLTKRAREMREYLSNGKRRRNVLQNVYLGVSAEDQTAADERIPLLLQTPAAHRWVSLEPLVGPVDLTHLCGGTRNVLSGRDFESLDIMEHDPPALDWVVGGGESGPNARPCDLAWLRDVVRQCREAGVPCWVKQLGANPFCGACRDAKDLKRCRNCYPPWYHDNRAGADPQEWPADLRVQDRPVDICRQLQTRESDRGRCACGGILT